MAFSIKMSSVHLSVFTMCMLACTGIKYTSSEKVNYSSVCIYYAHGSKLIYILCISWHQTIELRHSYSKAEQRKMCMRRTSYKNKLDDQIIGIGHFIVTF